MSEKNKVIKKTKNISNTNIRKVILLETIVFLVYFTLSMSICALFYFGNISLEKQYFISLAGFICAGIVSGYSVGKKIKVNGLLNGVLYNLPVIFIIVFISLILNDFTFDYKLIVSALAMLITSAVGGVFAVNSKQKKR